LGGHRKSKLKGQVKPKFGGRDGCWYLGIWRIYGPASPEGGIASPKWGPGRPVFSIGEPGKSYKHVRDGGKRWVIFGGRR
jgi:hypothetical protein